MNIGIRDTATALTDAETIMNCSNSFESLLSTMRIVKNNFESNWTGEENADRRSIIMALDNSINYYENKIIPALRGLGEGVHAFATATEHLANSTFY